MHLCNNDLHGYFKSELRARQEWCICNNDLHGYFKTTDRKRDRCIMGPLNLWHVPTPLKGKLWRGLVSDSKFKQPQGGATKGWAGLVYRARAVPIHLYNWRETGLVFGGENIKARESRQKQENSSWSPKWCAKELPGVLSMTFQTQKTHGNLGKWWEANRYQNLNQ